MLDWSIIADISTAITSVSLVIALLALIVENRSENVQSFLYMHSYLSQNTFNDARKNIRTKQCSKSYSDWSDDDMVDANNVCASYDQTGLLISIGLLDNKTKREFLSSSWGTSIIDQYESLEPFLNDAQTPTQTGREFFRHFVWLYNEAKKYQNHDTENRCAR